MVLDFFFRKSCLFSVWTKGKIRNIVEIEGKNLTSGHGVIATQGRVRKEKISQVGYGTAGFMHY